MRVMSPIYAPVYESWVQAATPVTLVPPPVYIHTYILYTYDTYRHIQSRSTPQKVIAYGITYIYYTEYHAAARDIIACVIIVLYL